MTNLPPQLYQIQTDDVLKIRNSLFLLVTVPFVLFLLKSAYTDYMKRIERRRKLYAEAYAVCMEYKEFVYVIYRRNGLDPEGERLRISEALRDVQKRISHYSGWLKTESKHVSNAYEDLLCALRMNVGAEMKKAWRADPITTDSEMTVKPKISYTGLEEAEEKFINAVRGRLYVFKR